MGRGGSRESMLVLSTAIESLRTLQTHRYATLWSIVRVDGVTLRFTDHDETIVTPSGSTFIPGGGFSASARSKHIGTEKSPNLEIRGIVNSENITEEDLRAGRYREASVSEWLIDWRYPWLGAFAKRVYTIVGVTFSTNGWEAQMEGNARKLRQASGRTAQRRCPHDLGQPILASLGPGQAGGCGVDLALFDDTGTVTSITDDKRKFEATAIGSQVDNYYRHGIITWNTGDNAGLSFECQKYINSGRKFTQFLNTPFVIQIGDTFRAIAGCDKERSTCKDKFDNLVNFGGLPWVPGTDKIIRVPRVPVWGE